MDEGQICTHAGDYVGRAGLGEVCVDAVYCQSGFCTDGVCRIGECEGDAICNAAQSKGFCIVPDSDQVARAKVMRNQTLIFGSR